MLVKSSLKVAFADAELQKHQYGYGGEGPCGHVLRDLRQGAWKEEKQVVAFSASAAR